MSGAVSPRGPAKTMALEGIRPVAIATSTPRPRADRTAAWVRGPIPKSAPMSVPSRSRTTRRIGNREATGASTGPLRSPSFSRSATRRIPLQPDDTRLPGEVMLERASPARPDIGREGADGFALVRTHLDQRDAGRRQRVGQAVDETADEGEAVRAAIQRKARFERGGDGQLVHRARRDVGQV